MYVNMPRSGVNIDGVSAPAFRHTLSMIFWVLICLFVLIIVAGAVGVWRFELDKEKTVFVYVAFGLAALATLAGIFALRPTNDTDGLAPGELAEILVPETGDAVGQCARISGVAGNLPQGMTLVTAKFRTQEATYYLERVSGWQHPSTLDKWSATQYFNDGDGLRYAVTLFMIPVTDVQASIDDPKFKESWFVESSALPATWTPLDDIAVNVNLSLKADGCA